jgi:hypothetical protein
MGMKEQYHARLGIKAVMVIVFVLVLSDTVREHE